MKRILYSRLYLRPNGVNLSFWNIGVHAS